KGIDLADTWLTFGFELPQLSNDIQLGALRREAALLRAEVCLIDPLYLCLLAGAGSEGLSAANLYDRGPLFKKVAKALLEVKCSPWLVHHFKTTRAAPYGEPQLEDLAYSGVREFARQWVLTSRREAYVPGTGSHRLYLAAGGSAGH